jgi:hypothetical protein
MFTPNVTLARLLEERKFGRSWGATWLLIGLSVLVMFVFAIFLFRFVSSHREPMMYLPDELDTRWLMLGVFALLLIGATVQSILYFVLGRVLYSWIIRLGLRISAGRSYPQDPYERADKGRLLALTHPYTSWISYWPTLLLPLFLSLLFLMPGFASILNGAEYGKPVDELGAQQFVLVIGIFFLCYYLVQFGMWIYMIVVRTISIQKIYGIGAGQAFWGPFLVYFLLYFAGFLLYVVVFIVGTILGGGPLDPGNAPDLNPHLSI